MAVMFLGSCGGGETSKDFIQEKTIKASNIKVYGTGKEYVKIVDGDYFLKVVDDKVVMAVKFELIKEYDGSGTPKMGNLTLIPLDKTGVAVPDLGLDFSPATMGDWGKIKDILSSKLGETVIISFEWSYFSKTEIQKRIMEETVSFEITRSDIKEEEVASNNSSSKSSNVKSSKSKSNNEDWDKVLKSYESYIDQYIKLMKKAQNGDTDAMTEYASMMVKATDLSEKMSNAGDDLSTSQMAKFIKLQTKLVNAAADMQN